MPFNPYVSKELNECKKHSWTSSVTIENQLYKIAGNSKNLFQKANKKSDRLKKALNILNQQEYSIIKINETHFRVKSQSFEQMFYDVYKTSSIGFECNCKDFMYRYDKLPNHECKHITSVKLFTLTKNRDLSNSTITDDCRSSPSISQPPIEIICPKCDCKITNKYGTYQTKSGKKPKRRCVQCGYVFAIHIDGFEYMMYDPSIVVEALDLYLMKGVSLRKVASHISIYHGKRITHSSLVFWMKKFTKIMKYYTDYLRPILSDTWQVDELMLDVKQTRQDRKKKQVVMWNAFDPNTKFWIAAHVSIQKEIDDARTFFKRAKTVAKSNPKTIITDSNPAYPQAIEWEFPRKDVLSHPPTTHIQYPSIAHSINNNAIERLHNEIGERTRTMRHVANVTTAQIFAEALRIMHNFVREHSSLGNKTPAEAAGIDLNLGKNRLYSLIRQSAKKFNEDHKFTASLRRKRLLSLVRWRNEENCIIAESKIRYITKTWHEINRILCEDGFERKTEGRKVFWLKQLNMEENEN